ncbi:MAG: hypothetical protein V4857_19545 [Pseudomonadota bacterium]
MQDIAKWMPEFMVSAESDRDLMRYFVKTPLIQSVVRSGRWMVIGRKGTGKTALYEYLKQAPPAEIDGYTTIALNFKDYPWPIQKLYREAMESEVSSYQRSWRYVIMVKALARLIESRKDDLNKDLIAARTLIESLYGSPNPGLIEIVKAKFLGLKSFNLPEIEAAGLSLGGIEFDEIAQHDELKRTLRANAFQLLDHFEGILKANFGDQKLMIVLDQLDENWLEGEIDEYSKILVNLIICAQGINNSSTYLGKLRIIVFLRADIYETLRFNDKNKIYQDGAVEIAWDYDALDKMIAERIEKYCPPDVELNLSEKSAAIFEKKTVRHGVPPLKHILRRSFYRPRDVIVYLNKIRNIHKPSPSGLYTSKDLYAAERNVSSSMYDELIDEWANQKPDFEAYLMVLQNIGFEIFTREQYIDTFKNMRSSATDGEINEVLRFLFANSIIGQKVSVNWEYACTNPHLQIDFGRPFHVNNGLKYRLVLTENRERQPRRPTPTAAT